MSTSIFRTNASQVDEIQVSSGEYAMLKTNTQYKSDVINSTSQSGGNNSGDIYYYRHPNHRTMVVLNNDRSSSVLLKGLTGSSTYTNENAVTQTFSGAIGTVVAGASSSGSNCVVTVTSGTFDTRTIVILNGLTNITYTAGQAVYQTGSLATGKVATTVTGQNVTVIMSSTEQFDTTNPVTIDNSNRGNPSSIVSTNIVSIDIGGTPIAVGTPTSIESTLTHCIKFGATTEAYGNENFPDKIEGTTAGNTAGTNVSVPDGTMKHIVNIAADGFISEVKFDNNAGTKGYLIGKDGKYVSSLKFDKKGQIATLVFLSHTWRLLNTGSNIQLTTSNVTDASVVTRMGENNWITSGTSAEHIYYWNSTNNNSSGNVGIGTNSPAEKLDVVGNIKCGANSYMTITDNNITGTSGNISFTSAGNLLLDSANTSTNIGIGVTNPTNKLQINGHVRIDGTNELRFNDGGEYIKSNGDVLYFGNNSSNVMILSANSLDLNTNSLINVGATTVSSLTVDDILIDNNHITNIDSITSKIECDLTLAAWNAASGDKSIKLMTGGLTRLTISEVGLSTFAGDVSIGDVSMDQTLTVTGTATVGGDLTISTSSTPANEAAANKLYLDGTDDYISSWNELMHFYMGGNQQLAIGNDAINCQNNTLIVGGALQVNTGNTADVHHGISRTALDTYTLALGVAPGATGSLYTDGSINIQSNIFCKSTDTADEGTAINVLRSNSHHFNISTRGGYISTMLGHNMQYGSSGALYFNNLASNGLYGSGSLSNNLYQAAGIMIGYFDASHNGIGFVVPSGSTKYTNSLISDHTVAYFSSDKNYFYKPIDAPSGKIGLLNIDDMGNINKTANSDINISINGNTYLKFDNTPTRIHAYKSFFADEGIMIGSTLFNATVKYNIASTQGWDNKRFIYFQESFTGQHRNIINDNLDKVDKIGYIYCSIDKGYNNINNITHYKPDINEALPILGLSTQEKQNTVFGVLSVNQERVYNMYLNYGIQFKDCPENRFLEKNHLYLNSVGEGGIWVSDYNGSLNNGDFITTSAIPGIGMRQDSAQLMNYTVAKITQSCDFNPETNSDNPNMIVKLEKIVTVSYKPKINIITNLIKKTVREYDPELNRMVVKEIEENKEVEENVMITVPVFNEDGTPVYKKDADGNILNDENGQPIQETEETQDMERVETVKYEEVYDADGNLVYEPLTDADGNPLYEPKYLMKYVRLDGTIIEKAVYDQEKADDSNAQVYRMAFVGCTYHCG